MARADRRKLSRTATQSITLKLDAPPTVARTGEQAWTMHGSHGVKSHIAQLIGIGGAIFVGVLPTGRLASESLYLAAVLSCPLMRIGM